MNPDTKALAVERAKANAAVAISRARQHHKLFAQIVPEDLEALLDAAALTALTQPPPVSEIRELKPITPREAFKLWKAAGGFQYGPRTETYAIREADWPKFIALLPQPPGSDGGWRVPEGFKLVPVELTREMMDAGNATGAACCGSDLSNDEMDQMVWSSQLAASPTPPSPSTVGEK